MNMKLLLWGVILIIALAPFLDSLDTPYIGSFILSPYLTYISVAVTPIIALYAYSGVKKSLELQDSELKIISNENKKQEIIRCLEKYEVLIKESLLNYKQTFITEQINEDQECNEYDFYQVMTMLLFETVYEQTVKPKNYYVEKSSIPKTFKENMMFEAIVITSLHVSRVAEYIHEYKKISDDNLAVGFYYNKYRVLAKRLKILGYINQGTYCFWEEKLNNF
ncbi:hypothetical protein [Psychromonas algicola]|uniref:hypothetical protein n=1 Tax=Psychromonas algicola TaxID=2555642 RepID=UPI0010680A90|nr:hypothetical protein [Psychromonas sp. RZ5]TEW50163.1 hypothetical protein E2R67_09870 [Psychromonas sp. RZ5]